jgi:hypothetical protein
MKPVALRYPVVLWLGIALILAASLGHLWLEVDRAMRVAPQLKLGPELVAHTFEVIANAQSLQRGVQDAERGQRGFLATGDVAYLELYRKSAGEAPALLARLKQRTTDNPEQQRRWPVLEQQIGAKLDELRQTLEVGERRGLEAARQIVRGSPASMACKASTPRWMRRSRRNGRWCANGSRAPRRSSARASAPR